MPTHSGLRILWGLFRLVSLPIIAVLLAFNLRRVLFALAILLPRQGTGEAPAASEGADRWPEVLILVPCRDEEEMIPDLCRSLDELDYPSERRRVVLIDDGSCDSTHSLMARSAGERPGWEVLALSPNVGKAAALNLALARFSFGEIVYVFDADHRPRPDVLKRAVRYFDESEVAGVNGRLVPGNPLASASAYYAAVESYLHQMVTMRAKDRLGLAPGLLGSNCGYRRSALAECGGFRDGALSEDTDMTLSLWQAGYRVRFAPDVVAHHQVPETVGGYLNQHRRWARGLNDVASGHAAALLRSRRLSLPVRIELLLFAAGYLDRIALACAGMFTLLSVLNKRLFSFPRWVLFFAFLTPLYQIAILFAEQRLPQSMWLRLPLIPLFFALDILAATRAMADSLSGRARVWSRTTRSQDKR